MEKNNTCEQLYSRSLNQKYQRKCQKCDHIEGEKDKELDKPFVPMGDIYTPECNCGDKNCDAQDK